MPCNVILRSCQDLQEVPRPGLPPLGQTHLTPEQRFAKHKSGEKAGRYVFRYGTWSRTTTSTPSRERAEEIEMHLTNYLRRHGYGVWSN